MFSQFFGSYLLQRRLITAAQLRDVLALQDSVHVKIGILAMDAGFMNAQQVEKVHRLQATIDKRFGEIAISEGYLNEDQVCQLLGRQNARHLFVSQALIDKGIMTFEQIERALTEFSNESGLTEAELDALRKNDVDRLAAVFVQMPDLGNPDVYSAYFSLFVKNMVRFIDSGIVLDRAERVREEPFDFLVHQEMDGRFKVFTGLAGAESAMAGFAGRFAKAPLTCMDELAWDSLKEFMNIQNGLFLSKLSNDWVELELAPCETRTASKIKSVGMVYKIPFSLPFGEFNFFIGLGSPVFE